MMIVSQMVGKNLENRKRCIMHNNADLAKLGKIERDRIGKCEACRWMNMLEKGLVSYNSKYTIYPDENTV